MYPCWPPQRRLCILFPEIDLGRKKKISTRKFGRSRVQLKIGVRVRERIIGYPYVWISDCLGFPTQASGSEWSLVEHTRVCSKRKSARKPHIPPPPTTTKAVSCRPPFVPHRMVSKLYSLKKKTDACGVVCEASPMAMPSRPLCSHRHRHMAGPRDRFPQTWQCCLQISWQAGSFFQCSRINRGSLSLPHKEQRHPPHVCV